MQLRSPSSGWGSRGCSCSRTPRLYRPSARRLRGAGVARVGEHAALTMRPVPCFSHLLTRRSTLQPLAHAAGGRAARDAGGCTEKREARERDCALPPVADDSTHQRCGCWSAPPGRRHAGAWCDKVWPNFGTGTKSLPRGSVGAQTVTDNLLYMRIYFVDRCCGVKRWGGTSVTRSRAQDRTFPLPLSPFAFSFSPPSCRARGARREASAPLENEY